ncbi:putative E3 ubiquitin-protein ligase HTD2, partial [Halocaridina rubra]
MKQYLNISILYGSKLSPSASSCQNLQDVEQRSRFGGIGNFMISRLGSLSFHDNSSANSNNNNNNNSNARLFNNNNDVISAPTAVNPGLLAAISDSTAFRLGSGSSLPPIRRQLMDAMVSESLVIFLFTIPEEVDSRRASVSSRQGSGRLRSARSDESLNSRSSTAQSSQRPVYPARTTRREDFMQDVRKAKETKSFSEMKKFYFDTFDSYASICATFKRNPDYDGARVDDPGLKTELVYTVHDSIKEMPSVVHKHFLKAVINALLQERPHLFSKDRVRALFIILQTPVFLSQSSYTVLAHVLRNITSLCNGDHQLLVSWFKTLEVSRLRTMVGIIIQFITVRQFPPPDRSLPPLSKSKWWIPTATK